MLIRNQQGVTLIEVLVGIAILALLMALGVPQYGTFLANARLRTTAESVANGLSLARAEAVKRNARVEFVLSNDDTDAANVNGLTLIDPKGTNWMVREWLPRTGNYAFIEGKFSAEGSGREASLVQINSSAPGYTGTTSFTGFGSLTTGSAIAFDITNPGAGVCDRWTPNLVTAGAGTINTTRGPMRCLSIRVSPGGQIRTCDPSIPATALTDTRRC